MTWRIRNSSVNSGGPGLSINVIQSINSSCLFWMANQTNDECFPLVTYLIHLKYSFSHFTKYNQTFDQCLHIRFIYSLFRFWNENEPLTCTQK